MTRLRLPRSLAPLLVAVALAGCGPKRVYTHADVATLPKLGDVMWAQAQAADPAFKRIGHTSLSDADYAVASNAGERLKLTSARLKEKDFSKGPEFEAFAEQLSQHADEILAAVAIKDAAKTVTALGATRQTCQGCHKQFR